MTKKKEQHPGKLPRQYTFIPNPYAEYRFTRCPGCEQKMRQRKLPLFIHVDPMNPWALNYTCRYCPDCDLLIAHQDQIEELRDDHPLCGVREDMICDICGKEGARVRHVTRSYGRGKDLLVIENIPVVSCPHCGESYLTAETLHEIERIKLHRKSFAQERAVSVAVFA